MRDWTVHIIGAGRVGTCLYRSLMNAGFTDVKLVKREDALPLQSHLIAICTPDQQIKSVADKLAEQLENPEEITVFHCSGSLSAGILESLHQVGATVGCYHPLKAVSPATKQFYPEDWFDIEGDDSALHIMEELAKLMEVRTLRVTEQQKKKLHVSAVVASNYLVTLKKIALEIYQPEEDQKGDLSAILHQLMSSTLDNLSELNPVEALTGPISRGDAATIQEHVKLLQIRPELLHLYIDLGVFTAEMIKDRMSLERYDEVLKVLNDRKEN